MNAKMPQVIPALLVGSIIGYFVRDSIIQGSKAYPKCITANNGTITSATGGPVIEAGEIPDSIMIGYIFDKTCGADPTIDRGLALAYLRQGGRVSLKEASIIFSESKARGDVALQALIEGIEK
ncbi:hypothetical protein [Rhizobium esperanzae]|uniref:Uncharacterized protein n=1 Tax=Rhizobium esperanzae TaxID=1967781 RepID=A0A7W6R5U1_9HYPH|nr:hypothetical protein [Rhizobium esperanzae]MBB4236963.1 hypothetical protein [Rhizobium esperanzae]